MNKSYCSLGLMSGTSMDGVDASIIQTDGQTKYKAILDEYFEYPKNTYQDLTTLRDKIKSSKDLKRFEKQTKSIEKEITLFHAKAASKIIKKLTPRNPDTKKVQSLRDIFLNEHDIKKGKLRYQKKGTKNKNTLNKKDSGISFAYTLVYQNYNN